MKRILFIFFALFSCVNAQQEQLLGHDPTYVNTQDLIYVPHSRWAFDYKEEIARKYNTSGLAESLFAEGNNPVYEYTYSGESHDIWRNPYAHEYFTQPEQHELYSGHTIRYEKDTRRFFEFFSGYDIIREEFYVLDSEIVPSTTSQYRRTPLIGIIFWSIVYTVLGCILFGILYLMKWDYSSRLARFSFFGSCILFACVWALLYGVIAVLAFLITALVWSIHTWRKEIRADEKWILFLYGKFIKTIVHL